MSPEKGDIIQVRKFKVKNIKAEPEEYSETYVVCKVWVDDYIASISCDSGEIVVLRKEQCRFLAKSGEFLLKKLLDSSASYK